MAFVHAEVWHLVVGKALIALASGACVTAIVIKTATSVDHDNTGTATSLVLVIRVLGFATGAQVSGAFLTAATPRGPTSPPNRPSSPASSSPASSARCPSSSSAP